MTTAAPAAEPKIFTEKDPWPDFGPGTVVAVHYGDYRQQEIWVACGSNIGNWYCLGNPNGNPAEGQVPEHPHWGDIVKRGPVTLLVATTLEGWRAGWDAGRLRMSEQIESLRDDEPGYSNQPN